MTKLSYLSLLFSVILLSSCSGANEGNAPSTEVEVPVVNTTTYMFSHGQTLMTSNGWTIDEDHSNFISTKQLSNGWDVEVRYE